MSKKFLLSPNHVKKTNYDEEVLRKNHDRECKLYQVIQRHSPSEFLPKIRSQRSSFLRGLGIIAVFFFCSAFSRSTTFDDRSICEKSQGVWREYGNICVDECEAKLDQFALCSAATTFGCECGKSRCWNDEKKTCVELKDYKKIFLARQKEEKKLAEEAKKKREAEAAENSDSILNNLTEKVGDNVNKILPETKVEEPKPAPEQPAPAGPPSAVVAPAGPTPFYLQQQEKAQKEEAERKKKEEEAKKTQQAPTISVPGLPVIPLPQ